MMHRLFLLLLVSCTLSISCNTSCPTKERFISSYDSFIENSIKLNESDLKDNQERFETFTSECYEKFHTEMTNKEKLHFWKQTIKYQSEKVTHAIGEDLLSPQLQEALERDIETFSSASKDELVKIFKEEIAPELNDAIEEVVNGIEEIGENLKDWLKEVEK